MLSLTSSIVISAGSIWIVIGKLFAMVALPCLAGVVVALCYVAVRRNLRAHHAVVTGALIGVGLAICNYAALWFNWHPLPNTLPMTGYAVVLVPATVLACMAVSWVTASRAASESVPRGD